MISRRARCAAAHPNFTILSLDESFRSTPAVLEVVDASIAHLGAEALGLDAA
jgi:ATP-dependent helicase/nuclease subunit A